VGANPNTSEVGQTNNIHPLTIKPQHHHPSINSQVTHILPNSQNVLLILRRPIPRPRRPNRRLHPSNRSLLHHTPRHDPRDLRLRRRSRTVRQHSIYHPGLIANATSNALKFGSQKINLHLSGHEFEPKASRVQPGSGDLCFITKHPIDDVLAAWKGAGIEVSVTWFDASCFETAC
jgi:hypothetical protein